MEDVLSPYRSRIFHALGVVGVAVLLPIAANDFLRGSPEAGSAAVLVALALGVNAFAIHRRKAPPVPPLLLVLAATLGIGVSIRARGFDGALWIYPAVLFFYFVLSRRAANVYNLVLSVLVTAMVYYYAGVETTFRFFLTVVATIVSSNVFLTIIGDLQARLLEQSILDPLTGAFNRRQMELSLGEAIARKRRYGTIVSLLMLDIDHFKTINDELGHSAGDNVLRSLAALVRERCRAADQLFRIGGEEFVVLLPDTDQSQAAVVAEHLRAGIAETEMLEGRQVSISVGVSELAADESLDTWLDEADAALYRAKSAGRNRVVGRLSAAS